MSQARINSTPNQDEINCNFADKLLRMNDGNGTINIKSNKGIAPTRNPRQPNATVNRPVKVIIKAYCSTVFNVVTPPKKPNNKPVMTRANPGHASLKHSTNVNSLRRIHKK